MARKLKRDLTVEEQLARGPLDLPFLMLVLLLTAIGVIMMFSASYADALYNMDDPTYYFMRQGLFAIGGVVIMYVISKINYQTLRWLSVFALVGSIILLIMVKIPGIGASGGGANRWIRAIGPLPRWQPSEAAKLGVILYFSARLSKRNTEKKRHFDKRTYSGHFLELLDRIGFLELVPYGVVLLIIAGLLLLQPHLSSTPPTIWPTVSPSGRTPGLIPRETATRSSSPSTPSAPEGCWASDLGTQDKNSSICPSCKTTMCSPSCVRSWALSVRL